MGKYKEINTVPTVFSVGTSEIYVNGRVKYYPDRNGELQLGVVDFFDRGGFRKKGFEANKATVWVSDRVYIHDPGLDTVSINPISGEEIRKWGYRIENDSPSRKAYDLGGSAKGRSRARTKLYDLARCNWDLDAMFTLTFDAAKVDRTNYGEIIKALNTWLSNRVRRFGLKYVAVPEYHADGASIHLHGMCNFDALTTTYSGHRHKGRKVWNIADFPYGFTVVKKIDETDTDRQAVAAYICKYITKDFQKVGGRYFLHGGELTKPTVLLRELSDEDIKVLVSAVDCARWTCPTPIGDYTRLTIKSPKKPEDGGV